MLSLFTFWMASRHVDLTIDIGNGLWDGVGWAYNDMIYMKTMMGI